MGFRGDVSVGEFRASRVCELKIHVIAECYMFDFALCGLIEGPRDLKSSVDDDARRRFMA